jgi:hypothetical protein
VDRRQEAHIALDQTAKHQELLRVTLMDWTYVELSLFFKNDAADFLMRSQAAAPSSIRHRAD